jgi:hypothetical protein
MAKFRVDFIGPGAEVTDRTISKKQFDEIGVVAPDLRWYKGQPAVIENPDATLLEYLKDHDDEFKIRELKGDDAAEADKPKG